MDIELKELSNIYLQNLQEEDDGAAGEGQNPQQAADVGAHAKAIRYQARRDNVPLPKAFNDYVAKNQLSGAERTALRQKLGFMGEETIAEKKGCNHSHKGEECEIHGKKECPSLEPVEEADDYKDRDKILNKAKPLHKHLYKNLHKADKDGDVNESRHYSWRTELSEYTDSNPKAKTDTKAGEKITEKKVKNTIKINPPQGMTEAIEEMGGQILEMVGIEEAVYGGTPKKKEEPKDTRMVVTAADKKGNTPAYQRMKAGDKRYKAADHMGEEVEDLEEIAPAVAAGGAAKLGKAALGFAARRIAPAAIRATGSVAGGAIKAAGSMAGGAISGGAALGAAAVKSGSNNNSQKKQTTTTTTTTEEVGSTSTNDAARKKALAAKEQMMRKQHMLDKQRMQAQKQLKIPSGHMEETEDSLRDKRQERGGVDGNVDYKRPPKPQFSANPAKKKAYDGMSALDRVKADIRGKYGKGAIIDTKKKG
jgi:hypothetical protein